MSYSAKHTFKKLRLVAAVTLAICGGLAHAASTVRVSSTATGSEANSSSFGPAISDDGRYVAFSSVATNLVLSNINNVSQVYWKDTLTGEIRLLSAANNGAAGNAASSEVSISGDGRYVAFSSAASNLVPNDTNQVKDVFLYDSITGSLNRVAQIGIEPNGLSHLPYVNRDGTHVVFSSMASNLVAGDVNGYRDVFLFTIKSGDIALISRNDAGEQTNSDSYASGISADANLIALASSASNLATGDTNGNYDIFLYDMRAGLMELISVSSAGVLSDNQSSFPSVSDNGRYVVFSSIAGNLVVGDTNGKYDIFLRDRQTRETTRISIGNNGEQANDLSWIPVISGNGRYVAYWSGASNIVAGDTNALGDIFIYDRVRGINEIASVSSSGALPNAVTERFIALSYDGVYVAFDSFAGNLVPNDTNRLSDVFVRVRDKAPNSPPTADAGAAQTQMCVAGSANFQLDGSASQDPDQDSLNYLWTWDFGTATGQRPVISLPYGQHSVSLLVDDGNGGQAQSSVSLNVADTFAPTIETLLSVSLEATSAQGAPYVLSYVAKDDCAAVTVQVQPTLSVYPVGTTTVNISAIDSAGNAATQAVQIKVTDTQPPVITAPTDVYTAATGLNTVVNLGNALTSDLFPVTLTNNAPTAFPVGTTLVTWTATDANGNQASANQVVTVVDATPPQLSVPSDMTVEANAKLSSVDIGSATAYDAVDGPLTATNNAPATYPLGTTLVTWYATDSQGNRSENVQRITVRDSTAPQITLPPDLIIEAGALLTPASQIMLGKATATDIFAVTISNDAPATYPLGTTAVTWSAQDANGNISRGRQLVTLADTTAPSYRFELIRTQIDEFHHKWVHVATVSEVKDAVSARPEVEITVAVNPSDSRHSHRRDTQDWKVEQVGSQWRVWVRAEREGDHRKGRQYAITVSIVDGAGNQATATKTVTVEHDRRHHRKHDDR